MTAVQWWCTGVMLDRIFGQQHTSPNVPYVDSASQHAVGSIPAQSISPDTGVKIDYTV